MICPFCQSELDVDELSCPNCSAVFPRRTPGLLGVRIRIFALTGGMLLLCSMLLTYCVLNYLPGGRDSAYYAPGSPQVASGPGPDMKSPVLQRILQLWQAGVQPSQNPNPAVIIKSH